MLDQAQQVTVADGLAEQVQRGDVPVLPQRQDIAHLVLGAAVDIHKVVA